MSGRTAGSIRLVAQLHRGTRTERPAQERDELGLGAASLQVGDHRQIDVVRVLIQALAGELLDEELELGLRDQADLLFVLVVVELNHLVSPGTPGMAVPSSIGAAPASQGQKVSPETARRKQGDRPASHA